MEDFSVTLKGSQEYNAPEIVIRGSYQLVFEALHEVAQIELGANRLTLGQVAAQAARQFHSDYAVGSKLGAKPVDEPRQPSAEAQQQALQNFVAGPDLDGLAELQRRLDAAQKTADLSQLWREYKKQAQGSEDIQEMFREAQARIKKAAS